MCVLVKDGMTGGWNDGGPGRQALTCLALSSGAVLTVLSGTACLACLAAEQGECPLTGCVASGMSWASWRHDSC